MSKSSPRSSPLIGRRELPPPPPLSSTASSAIPRPTSPRSTPPATPPLSAGTGSDGGNEFVTPPQTPPPPPRRGNSPRFEAPPRYLLSILEGGRGWVQGSSKGGSATRLKRAPSILMRFCPQSTFIWYSFKSHFTRKTPFKNKHFYLKTTEIIHLRNCNKGFRKSLSILIVVLLSQ